MPEVTTKPQAPQSTVDGASLFGEAAQAPQTCVEKEVRRIKEKEDTTPDPRERVRLMFNRLDHEILQFLRNNHKYKSPVSSARIQQLAMGLWDHLKRLGGDKWEYEEPKSRYERDLKEICESLVDLCTGLRLHKDKDKVMLIPRDKIEKALIKSIEEGL
jgi:hypothetical protein